MASTMILEMNVAKHFWANIVNTTCYIHIRINIIKILNKTPYKLWKEIKPNIFYFYKFSCICYVLNTKENLDKFDSRSQKGIFLGYSKRSEAYRVSIKETMIVEESIHVKLDENYLDHKKSKLAEYFQDLKHQKSKKN